MISGYRLMWLLVMFDLPVTTKEHRRNYKEFHDYLVDEGFSRIQFSIYARPCATEEKTAVHVDRVIDALPPEGEVRILKFTDKQWTRTLLFRRSRISSPELPPEQFEFFDEDLDPVVDDDPHAEIRLRIYVAEKRRDDYGKPTKKPPQRSKPKNDEPTLDFFD